MKQAVARCAAVLLLAVLAAHARQLFWQADYTGILDNREYFGLPVRSETLFLGRLAVGGGVVFDTAHTLAVEGVALHEFGSSFDDDRFRLAAYYQFSRQPFLFAMGVIPREIAGAFPRALLNDSVSYFRPHIEGGVFAVGAEWGRQVVWADWVGRQTPDTREQFLIGLSGALWRPYLFGDYHALYFHDAGRWREPPDKLSEYYGGRGRVGVAFTDMRRIDTVAVGVGALLSTTRTRDSTAWVSREGFVATADLLAPRLGVRSCVYVGEPQVSTWGDGLYHASSYLRVDIYGVPILSERVRAAFSWCTHVVDGEVGFSQEFDLRVRIGQTLALRHKRRRARNKAAEDALATQP